MTIKQTIYDVIVIGAGASGCATAINCGLRGGSVLLLEKNSKIAKKILVTGNGRCNFTNRNIDSSCYHGDIDPLHFLIKNFQTEDALHFFHSLGISAHEREGYYYPLSNQAKSVVKAFETGLNAANVKIKCNQTICNIYREHDLFHVVTDTGYAYLGKHIVFATGLLNADGHGVDDSAFLLLKKLGHTVTSLTPALVGVVCGGTDFRKISGIRSNCEITLLVDGEPIDREAGEVQFCDYGISGIPVFQLASRAGIAFSTGHSVSFMLNLLPEFSRRELEEELRYRQEHFADILNGLLPDKLAASVLSEEGTADLSRLGDRIYKWKIPMIGMRDYQFAQVCAGGILSEQLLPGSLESAYVPGLYFAGELLNIDGKCGGYNLHFAWACGNFLGNSIL